MKLAIIRWCWFLLPVTLFAAIDWGTSDYRHFVIQRCKLDGTATNIVEFGLRDDGVVVWREIKQQPGWVTNSPAERVVLPPVWGFTNMVIPLQNWGTNIYYVPTVEAR